MALSYVVYPPNGTSQFSVPFPFMDREDVTVLYNDEPVTFTWVSDSLIDLGFTPTSLDTVRIQRTTSTTREVVEFESGSTLSQSELEQAFKQSFLISQEATDRVNDLETLLESDPESGLPLPAVTSPNYFVVSTGVNAWTVKTVAEVNTLLGTSVIVPAAQAGKFLTCETGSADYEIVTASDMRTRLGLGSLALSNTALGSSASLDVGTDSGDIVQLITTSGSVSLPVVSGQNLTDVLHSMIGARYEHRTAAGVNPGVAGVNPDEGNNFVEATWNTRRITDTIDNGSAGGITRSGNQITLAPGLYLVNILASLGLVTAIDSSLRIGSSLRLQNVTDSTTAMTSNNNIRMPNPWVFWDDHLYGLLDLRGNASSKTFEIQHWAEDNGGAELAPGYSVNGLSSNTHMTVSIVRIQ